MNLEAMDRPTFEAEFTEVLKTLFLAYKADFESELGYEVDTEEKVQTIVLQAISEMKKNCSATMNKIPARERSTAPPAPKEQKKVLPNRTAPAQPVKLIEGAWTVKNIRTPDKNLKGDATFKLFFRSYDAATNRGTFKWERTEYTGINFVFLIWKGDYSVSGDKLVLDFTEGSKDRGVFDYSVQGGQLRLQGRWEGSDWLIEARR